MEDKSDDHGDFGDWCGWNEWDDDGFWAESWWYDDDWEATDDGYQDNAWYEEDEEFYEAEEQPWNVDPAGEPGYQGEDSRRATSTASTVTSVEASGAWQQTAQCVARAKEAESQARKGSPRASFGRASQKAKDEESMAPSVLGSSVLRRDHGALESPAHGIRATSRTTTTTRSTRNPNQLRHARQGLHLGDSPPKDPPRPPASAPKVQRLGVIEHEERVLSGPLAP